MPRRGETAVVDDRPHTGDDPLIDGVSAAISALEDIIEELDGIDRAAVVAALDLAQGALDDLQAVREGLVERARQEA